jgi:diaminopimelate decarboxylase
MLQRRERAGAGTPRGCSAARGPDRPVSLRINPDVDARTHPYISTGMAGNKFGIPHGARSTSIAAPPACRDPDRGHRLPHRLADPGDGTARRGARARARARARAARRGHRLEHVDLGGGFGIRYRDEVPLDYRAYCRHLAQRLAGQGITLLLEPGRAIVGNAGLLLTRSNT